MTGFMVEEECIEVVVVSGATTLGHRTTDGELSEELAQAGFRVRLAQPAFRPLPRLLRRQPITDLYEAIVLARSARRAATTQRTVWVHGTTTATLFAPRFLLKRSALRFDALASENRRGKRNLVQRRLEQRALRYIPVLMPMRLQRAPELATRFPDKIVIPLPPVIASIRVRGNYERQGAVFYAGSPHKKGLDKAVVAWAASSEDRLSVVGLEADAALKYLTASGIPVPATVQFLGKLSPAAFRELLRKSLFALSASRYEDFGAAQLEALAAGCILISTPSDGPYEASNILRGVDSRLLAQSSEPHHLATAITYARGLDETRQESIRSASAVVLRDYSLTEFRLRTRGPIADAIKAIAIPPGAVRTHDSSH